MSSLRRLISDVMYVMHADATEDTFLQVGNQGRFLDLFEVSDICGGSGRESRIEG